jgi:hypothetical protein
MLISFTRALRALLSILSRFAIARRFTRFCQSRMMPGRDASVASSASRSTCWHVSTPQAWGETFKEVASPFPSLANNRSKRIERPESSKSRLADGTSSLLFLPDRSKQKLGNFGDGPRSSDLPTDAAAYNSSNSCCIANDHFFE